jgi:glycosyltransferase involved in cell wall biosynthesis
MSDSKHQQDLPNKPTKRCMAFYAPLKSPLHPTPSGDRKIAQLFSKALSDAGFGVILASQLRSFDKSGDPIRQRRLISLAKREAARILRRWAQSNTKPIAWFSYHLYYKAPDLIGPIICQQLNIPYIVSEASWANKRANGPWASYNRQLDKALQIASKVICINPIDRVALDSYYQNREHSPIVSINAFIDKNLIKSHKSRADIAKLYQFKNQLPWIVCIAMMREGDKHRSFEQLSEVIHKTESSHQLLIIGDGVMREQVSALFSEHKHVSFAGALKILDIAALLPQFEILIWPAVNEALGMVFLEAQQAGLAIISADHGGVSSIVAHQKSGFVCPVNDTQVMADKLELLLQDRSFLKQMQKSAKKNIIENHSLANTSLQLEKIINSVL